MSTLIVRLREFTRQMWTGSAPLSVVCLLMLASAALAVLGLAFDSGQVNGMPVWMKPFKFGISTAIYTGTLAWFCGLVEARRAAWVTAIGLIFEIAIIDIQAARGVSSHFNNTSALNAALFTTMGALIAVVWVAGIVVAIALFRRKFADAAWGWALRLGLAVTLLGAATGGLMTVPTRDQMATMRQGHNSAAMGAHTVGAPDGGPGIPLLGWSAEHGDLRVPHFFGLHAAQLIPLLVWGLRRRRIHLSTVFGITACYVGLIGILAWQAFRGQSIVNPDGLTLSALALWLAASMAMLTRAFVGRTQEATA